MKTLYYIDDIGEVQGPVSRLELDSLHRAGYITAATQVCEEGTENWKPYSYATVSVELKRQEKKLPTIAPIISVPKEQSKAKESCFKGISRGQGTTIIVLLLIASGAPFFSLLKPTEKWEYRIESPSDYTIKTMMDIYGADGWELVTARRASDGSKTMSYECIMKRRKK